MNDVLIRRAALADVEKLVELKLLLQRHCEEANPSIWRITEEGKKLLKQKIEDGLKDTDSRVFVAVMDGQIIGYAHGGVESRVDYSPNRVGYISTIYVERRFRRKGVGTRLVKRLFVFFSSERVEHVTLRYIVGNDEARDFWKKLGFEPIITTAGKDVKELGSHQE